MRSAASGEDRLPTLLQERRSATKRVEQLERFMGATASPSSEIGASEMVEGADSRGQLDLEIPTLKSLFIELRKDERTLACGTAFLAAIDRQSHCALITTGTMLQAEIKKQISACTAMVRFLITLLSISTLMLRLLASGRKYLFRYIDRMEPRIG
jgi:hypothetical protein